MCAVNCAIHFTRIYNNDSNIVRWPFEGSVVSAYLICGTQRLYWFAWGVRLSRLSVGFRTHLKCNFISFHLTVLYDLRTHSLILTGYVIMLPCTTGAVASSIENCTVMGKAEHRENPALIGDRVLVVCLSTCCTQLNIDLNTF